jgi:hypothetical protein
VIKRYPKIAEKDSAENRSYLEAYRELKASGEESFFEDPQWPLKLADSVAKRESWEKPREAEFAAGKIAEASQRPVAHPQEPRIFEITAVPEGETLNIRSGPGLNFPIVAKLANGVGGVQIRGEAVLNEKDEWVPIIVRGTKGWTRPKFLAPHNVARDCSE